MSVHISDSVGNGIAWTAIALGIVASVHFLIEFTTATLNDHRNERIKSEMIDSLTKRYGIKIGKRDTVNPHTWIWERDYGSVQVKLNFRKVDGHWCLFYNKSDTQSFLVDKESLQKFLAQIEKDLETFVDDVRSARSQLVEPSDIPS
ncbi:MAG: hypothetical protein WA843_02360 [Candidatus Saccharimonadales bacterium]